MHTAISTCKTSLWNPTRSCRPSSKVKTCLLPMPISRVRNCEAIFGHANNSIFLFMVDARDYENMAETTVTELTILPSVNWDEGSLVAVLTVHAGRTMVSSLTPAGTIHLAGCLSQWSTRSPSSAVEELNADQIQRCWWWSVIVSLADDCLHWVKKVNHAKFNLRTVHSDPTPPYKWA